MNVYFMSAEDVDVHLGNMPEISYLWSLLARKVSEDGEHERAIEYYKEALDNARGRIEKAFILSDIAECCELSGKSEEAGRYRAMSKSMINNRESQKF